VNIQHYVFGGIGFGLLVFELTPAKELEGDGDDVAEGFH
jgi:hypothetical protein